MPLKSWGKSYIDRCITIYNIDYATTQEELLAHFKKIDGFEKMFLLKDPQHPEISNRGIAYVAYSKAKDADYALRTLNHTLIGNRRIRIEKSFEQELKTKQKQSKKDIIDDYPPEPPLLDLEDIQMLEPEFLHHSKSERHRRSHHGLHSHIDRYGNLERIHHHSYRHHRSSSRSGAIDPLEYDYLDPQFIRSRIQMTSSSPLFHEHSNLAPPMSPLYVERPHIEVNNKVEDMVNELSILFELYRDALLTQNISDMKDQKNVK